MTTEEHRADEDARDVREHDAGEHAEAIVVDCYRCREEASDLGMGNRLPEPDPWAGATSDQVEASAQVGPDDPFEEWREALIEYGAGQINGVMYRAVRERALLVVNAREREAAR